MAFSEFQTKKLSFAFNKYDVSNDGVLTLSDFEEIAQKVAQKLGINSGSPDHDKIMAAYRAIWDGYFKPADVDGNNKVVLEEYIKACERFIESPSARKMGTNLNKRLYDAIDLDGNGSIDKKEFIVFLTTIGSSETDAKIAFSHLDTDKNGFISREEFVQNLYDYHTTQDTQSPANWFYGSMG
ncbi:EF-hand domain-containing protein [Coleofasciculus sp. E2-BRE-01]|uniref:EF-hand domain-containing protein n=1 Tax=Coleofasciculus sp. E2-BRE-01 TaxID=3069524 RepID=UPI0032FBF5F0